MWMMHAWCVMFAGIHPSRMSESLVPRAMECMHRLDLGLYSHPKEFYRMQSEPMLTPEEIFPLEYHRF